MLYNGGKPGLLVAAAALQLGWPTTTIEYRKALRLAGVPYVVVPYEADSQLA
jgi:hypothetical protein